MSIVIGSSAAAVQHPYAGAIDSAVSVAEACIRGSGVERAAIDILINTGIYKDANRIEPASAAFIQRQLNINADPLRDGFDHTTFAFDLSNGSDGFLPAVQVIDALFRTGGAHNALVLSSNAAAVEITAGISRSQLVAAAALLKRSDEKDQGFQDIAFYCDDDAEPSVSGYCDPMEFGPGAAEHVTIQAGGRVPEPIDDFILAKVMDYLNERRIDPATISFMLSSRRHEEFGRRVAEATGIRSGLPTSRLLDDAALGSGLMLGWDVARKAHLLTPGTTILMIEAGPGRIAGLALYNC